MYRVLNDHKIRLQIPRYRRPYAYGDPKPLRAHQTPLRMVAKGTQPERRQLKMRVSSLPNRYRKYVQSPLAPAEGAAGGYGRLLIALGDGSFRHSMRGHASTSTAKCIFQELTKLGEMVRWVDEHRTSKCCPSCGEEMEGAVLVKRPQESRQQPQSQGRLKRATRKANLAARFAAKQGLPVPPPAPPGMTHRAVRDDGRRRQPPRVDGDAYVPRNRFKTGDAFPSPFDAGAYDRRQLLTPWALKYCGTCNRLWCRDKNAPHNFCSRMVYLLAQPKEARQDGPAYLCRQTRQDDVSAPKPKRVAKRKRGGAVDASAAKAAPGYSHLVSNNKWTTGAYERAPE